MTATSGSGFGPFERFLAWLSPDRDLALGKHDDLQKKITKYFVRKGCDDPEELFSETRDRVVKITSSSDTYPNPDALFYSVANKVWQEYRRRPRPEPLVDEPAIPDGAGGAKQKEQEAHCLDRCLEKLPHPERELINRYYLGRGRDKIEERKRLAAENGGENTLRIKTFRIRSRLRLCLDGCMSQMGVN